MSFSSMPYSKLARGLLAHRQFHYGKRFERDQPFLDIQEGYQEMLMNGLKRVCFVTIGATAKFNELILAALSEDVVQALADNEFTHLMIQYGQSVALFEGAKAVDTKGLTVTGFDFNFKEGLKKYMRATQELAEVSKGGLVVCHAGAGTVLDAMRLGLKIIVVPNDSLLDNHQRELAEILEEEGYVSQSSPSNLAAAIRATFSKNEKQWVGATASLAGIVDEMLDYQSDEKENDWKQRLG